MKTGTEGEKKQSEGIKDGEKQGATSQRDMRHEKRDQQKGREK